VQVLKEKEEEEKKPAKKQSLWVCPCPIVLRVYQRYSSLLFVARERAQCTKNFFVDFVFFWESRKTNLFRFFGGEGEEKQNKNKNLGEK